VVRLPVRDGIATSQRTIAYETAKVNMVMAGTINLRTEGLDLAIRPTVKEGIGIGASALSELVRVTGTLSDPSVGIDTLGSARAALSVGGAILTGGLSLLGEAAFSKVTADPHPCQTALAAAPAKAPAPGQRRRTRASSAPAALLRRRCRSVAVTRCAAASSRRTPGSITASPSPGLPPGRRKP
jgi:hypothetical protein